MTKREQIKLWMIHLNTESSQSFADLKALNEWNKVIFVQKLH